MLKSQDDNQRGRVRRKPFEQITDLVEKSLSNTSSAVDCNHDGVEASAMDMSADYFEGRKYWQPYFTSVQGSVDK
jgi:hypothetical protein